MESAVIIEDDDVIVTASWSNGEKSFFEFEGEFSGGEITRKLISFVVQTTEQKEKQEENKRTREKQINKRT